MPRYLTTLCFLGLCLATAGHVASVPSAGGREASGSEDADDTARLQAQLDRGGAVRLGRSTYRLSKPLVVDLDRVGFVSVNGDGVARLVMAGPGPAIRILGTHAGTADPPSMKANIWTKQRAPVIAGLEIVGDHPEADGIEAQGTVQVILTRLLIRKARHAIHLVGRNRNVLISDCHLYENRGVGLFLDNVNLHQINVTGCHISYNADGGIVSRKGDVRNLQVTGCDIEANTVNDGAANVLLDSAESLNGTGEVAITGCTVQHSVKGVRSANVRILGRSNPAKEMPLVRQGNVTITGNIFSDVQDNVHLKGCRGVVVSGNTFWEGYKHNLLVEQCASVVVGPNNLDRNPHYDRYGKAREARNAVVFQDCEDITISGLHLTNVRAEAALQVSECKRVNISGCTILDSQGVGLRLEGVSNSMVSGCLIRDDRKDVRPDRSFVLRGGKGNSVQNNVFADGVEIEKEALRPEGGR